MAQLAKERAAFDLILCGDLNAQPNSVALRRLYALPCLIESAARLTACQVTHFATVYPRQVKFRSAYEVYKYKNGDKDKANDKQGTMSGCLEHEHEAIVRGHPDYTYFGPDAAETLDYILHSDTYLCMLLWSGRLTTLQVLKLPAKDIVAHEHGLPNSLCPSDHLPIEATLQFSA